MLPVVLTCQDPSVNCLGVNVLTYTGTMWLSYSWNVLLPLFHPATEVLQRMNGNTASGIECQWDLSLDTPPPTQTHSLEK